MLEASCTLCFHHCRLDNGKTGACKARTNHDGKIEPKAWGNITALALDPIEKKPLAKFHPGSQILSFGLAGCSLHCPFCQNWEISQQDVQGTKVTPEQLVQKALELVPYGNIGIAATYNEPLTSLEFVTETFKLAKEKGLKTVLVTSGNATPVAYKQILPYTDAVNVDLKGYSQDFYDWVKGDLESTKSFIKEAAKTCHVEVTTLVIPGKNDSPAQMEAQAKWLAEINPSIVLHLSRYFPRYKYKEAPTPISTLKSLQSIANKHLDTVLLGNV